MNRSNTPETPSATADKIAHTPTQEYDYFEGCLRDVFEPTENQIAVINRKTGKRVCTINQSLPEEAKRRYQRLIAAAPELLEACKMMLIRIEGMPESQCPRGLVYDLARAAIAKAEGK